MIANAVMGAAGNVANTAIDGNGDAGTYIMSALEGAAIGTIAGKLGGSGTASKHVSNHFWCMAKSGGRNMSYYLSQVGSQAIRDGKKAIGGILKSTIPSITKELIKAGIQ